MENKLPPVFSPDNSDEAKQRRIDHHFLFPKVTEITPPRHRVTKDDFIEPLLVLGEWGQVIEVNFRQDEPEDLIA